MGFFGGFLASDIIWKKDVIIKSTRAFLSLHVSFFLYHHMTTLMSCKTSQDFHVVKTPQIPTASLLHLQASRRMLDDELTARLAIQTRAFSFHHSSLSSESGSTSNSTYERIFPLCADYQEPSRLIRKLPEFSQSTEHLGKLSKGNKWTSLEVSYSDTSHPPSFLFQIRIEYPLQSLCSRRLRWCPPLCWGRYHQSAGVFGQQHLLHHSCQHEFLCWHRFIHEGVPQTEAHLQGETGRGPVWRSMPSSSNVCWRCFKGFKLIFSSPPLCCCNFIAIIYKIQWQRLLPGKSSRLWNHYMLPDRKHLVVLNRWFRGMPSGWWTDKVLL